MNTMMLLEMAAGGFGDRVAFTDPTSGHSITYQELYDAAVRPLTTSANRAPAASPCWT